MHDPSTVAFEIRYPWYRHRPWPKRTRRRVGEHQWIWDQMTEAERARCDRHWRDGYRESFITIWHEDPERDGSDDSCGFSFVKLSRRQMERLKNFAWSEARNPHYMRCPYEKWDGTLVEAEVLFRGLLLNVARVLDIRMRFDEAAAMASRIVQTPDCVPASHWFCFKPGYHTNGRADTREDREDVFTQRLYQAARIILTERRPWWRHPRWHIWHWRFQVHPLQHFKRWAFSRCAHCRGRFAWGECPHSTSWSGTGPRWFRGEAGVMHNQCSMVAEAKRKEAAS